ncbi:related to AIM2 - cytoplasmic protein involved in mitochondrial function or organization [Ustilago bromivora]|uniref:Related to AIM2 - cytoplasmic protein involved in mitochondrial function or organization n=1 Tax=Ustilago bromivora TaxID=307758 RepID=A0A8H8QNX4_9BASI|nr:related to AIM2 - cytoplasmic protein involved in mitochondrial function or organization [Ustilago bromivora]
MASTTPNETGISGGFCVHCVTGFRIPGEPKGKMEKIHSYDTYVATPTNPSSDSAAKAIIYFYDAFGLKLDNNKVIPDKIADTTVGVAFTLAAPFFLRNLPQTKIGPLKNWIESLKASHGYTRLGGTGFCYGGKLVIALNATDHINVSVANHPSFITKGDIAALKNPVLFNCAEEDPVFSADYAKQVEKEWNEKGAKQAFKFNHYPNTVKEAFEKALQEGVNWWKAHL